MKVMLFLSLTVLLTVNAAMTQKYKYQMPPSCKGQTYCTDKSHHPDGYPSDEKLRAAVTKWGLNKTETIQPASAFSQREGERELMGCRAHYENATIYYIVDKNGVTQPVIQLKGIFEQTHELRYCRNENRYKNCTDKKLKLLSSKNSNCTNQYMFFNFIIFNSSEQVELAQAEIPVCCKCYI